MYSASKRRPRARPDPMAENIEEESQTETISLDPLLHVLFEQEILPEEQIVDMQLEHNESEKPLRNIVLDSGLIPEDDLLELIAGYHDTRVINLPATDIPPDVVHSVPAGVARMYNCVPVEAGSSTVELAVCDLQIDVVQCERAAVALRHAVQAKFGHGLPGVVCRGLRGCVR